MIFRILGGFCLLSASFSYIAGRHKAEVCRLEALEYALACIKHVGIKIRLFDTPAPELLSDFHSKTRFDQLHDLKDCAECLPTYMSEEDGEVFRRFCTSIGGAYKDDALQMCENAQIRLEKSLKQAEDEYPARKRLYFSLPVLLTCAVMVLLW